MKKFKNILITIMLITISTIVIGCNKEPKEALKDSNVTQNILEVVKDKYYIDILTEEDNEVNPLAMIYYFKDDEIIIENLANNGEKISKFEHINTEIKDNSIKYTIEEIYDGEKMKSYAKFILYDNKLQFESTWSKLKEIKLLHKEECEKIIIKSFDNLTEEFSKKFNLEIGELDKNLIDNTETQEKIGDQSAESLVRQLLNDDNWATNGIVVIDSKEYYAVEESSVGADFRYLVDVYTAEVFVEIADKMGTLIPFEESKSNNNKINQISEFTVEDAIDILQANGYFSGRDYEYVKGNCLSRDISTNEIICEENKGIKYYSFWIDHVATDVLENGSILTAVDDWWYE